MGFEDAASRAGIDAGLPMRPSASAVTRRSCGDSESNSRIRFGTAVSLRQRAIEWTAAWRTVSSESSSEWMVAARASGASILVSAQTASVRALASELVARVLPQRGDGLRTGFAQRVDGAFANRPTFILKSACQLFGRGVVPTELESARIIDWFRVRSTNPIDRTEHVGLVKLRGRTTELVPSASVGDDETAIGVFGDVRDMKVGVVRDEKVIVDGAEGCAVGN